MSCLISQFVSGSRGNRTQTPRLQRPIPLPFITPPPHTHTPSHSCHTTTTVISLSKCPFWNQIKTSYNDGKYPDSRDPIPAYKSWSLEWNLGI